MAGFFQRLFGQAPKIREPFAEFVLRSHYEGGKLSLEDALNSYLRLHGLRIQKGLNEPARLVEDRTKLAVLDEFLLTHPIDTIPQGFRSYIGLLRNQVELGEMLAKHPKTKP